MRIISYLKKDKLFLSVTFLTLCYMLFLAYVYYKHATTFNFMDEYTNIVAGYFMNRGKILYTDIFVNHQPLMAFFSSWLLQATTPETLYQIIRDHRLLVIIFAFISNILLIIRFRYVAIGFIIFFETLKYYLFGNIFLAESFIIYPFVYVLGILSDAYTKRKSISFTDTILSAIFTWFIIAMREPFIPLAIILYALVLWKHKIKKNILISLALFACITLLSLLFINTQEYFFQVIWANIEYMIPYEMKIKQTNFALPIAFFYPLSIFFDQGWNIYRVVLLALDILFLFLFGSLMIKSKQKNYLILIFLSLGLANIRWVPSNAIFYGAFHQIVWFGMFVFSLFYMLQELYKKYKKYFLSVMMLSICIFLGMIISPQLFIHEKVDGVESFTTNYARFYTAGRIINELGAPSDEVFVYGSESLVYVEAKRESAYPYVMYYPVMEAIPIYVHARDEMYKTNPPTFYFYDRGKSKDTIIPHYRKQQYYTVIFDKKPIGLYIREDRVKTLTKEQIDKLNQQKFTLEKNIY